MKITVILMLSACFTASANGFSQITLSEKNVPLQLVFKKIQLQSGYDFLYSYELLQQAGNISVELRHASLQQALTACLRGKPLTYNIIGKTVIIKPLDNAYTQPADTALQNQPPPLIDVKGRVVNEKSEPVLATVLVKGATNSTGTDENGYFELHGVDENATLVITGVNIETRTIKVNGRSDLGIIAVKIRSTPMDELQVIAYGTTSKRFNVGAVSTVKAEEIERQPVTNVFLALQGRVPGLTITPQSGAPGTTVKVQVRGQNTLSSSVNAFKPFDQPLIIIDGVPFAPQNQNINLLYSMGGGYGTPTYLGFGALSSINPNDIESISVLRDADATSIYGSQGANGVILITTKKGAPGKTSFSMRVNTGPNKITRRMEFLNTQQYLELRKEALQNDGLTLPPVYDGTYPDIQLFDSTKYTDWFHEFLGKTSNNTDIQASLTGGTDNMSFILSAGYNHASYTFPGDFAEKRLSLHSGFRYSSKNNKLTIDFSADFSYARNNNSANPDAGAINRLPPNTPDLLDENGDLVWNYKGLDFGYAFIGVSSVFYQHYAYLKQSYLMKKYNFNNSLQLSYKLAQGLSATINLGYSRFNASETAQFPMAAQSPADLYRQGSASFAKNEFETVNIEPQLNYQKNIGRGVFSVLAGATYKSNTNSNQRITGTDYVNDAFLGSLTGAGRIVEGYSNDIIYKYIGAYGRAGYIYDNKYILNVTGRRDGSSNFGPGNQYGTFGSVGAGWIASDEKFFDKVRSVFSLVKLSANYGTNGSDGVEPYNYQDYWTAVSYFTPFQGLRPYTPVNLYNPDYSWASKRTWNMALDLGLFNDRLLLNATWYRSRTGNQLVGVALPSQTGFTSVTDNLNATVQNAGWEFTLSSSNITGKNFTWRSSANVFFNRNKLVAFPDFDKSAYTFIYTIGQSLSTVQGFQYKGVNETTGLFEYYDGHGNATYNLNYDLVGNGGDRQVIADLQPKFTGGLDNTFTYKGFTLSVFFQFAKQIAPNYLFGVYTGNLPGMHGNVPALVGNRWRKPGDQSPIMRSTTGFLPGAYESANFFYQSTGAYGDASYIRLKTLSLSYSFPSSFIKKAGMENLSVYANAQNLLTITRYEFGDPELPGQIAGIPLQRTIAIGLLFNF